MHLFGEALVSIAHLAYRVEAAQPPQSAADAAIRRTLEARKTRFQERALVNGRLERNIRVDYLVQIGKEREPIKQAAALLSPGRGLR